MCGVKLMDRRNTEELMAMLVKKSLSVGRQKRAVCGGTVMF